MNDKDCSFRDFEVGGFKFSFVVIIDDLRDISVVSCKKVEVCSHGGWFTWQPHQVIVKGRVTGEATIFPKTDTVHCNLEKEE